MLNKHIENFIEEMKICFPEVWSQMSPTERARRVAKDFTLYVVEDIHHIIRARKANARLAKSEAVKDKRKKKEAQDRYQIKWAGYVISAQQYYGDITYEYALSLWGEAGPEMMYSGVRSLTDEHEEICFREALFAAGFGSNDEKWFDRVVKYWKKYHK